MCVGTSIVFGKSEKIVFTGLLPLELESVPISMPNSRYLGTVLESGVFSTAVLQDETAVCMLAVCHVGHGCLCMFFFLGRLVMYFKMEGREDSSVVTRRL